MVLMLEGKGSQQKTFMRLMEDVMLVKMCMINMILTTIPMNLLKKEVTQIYAYKLVYSVMV